MMIDDLDAQDGDDSLLAEWAAELADRVRAGEPVDLEDLAREHPERAGALRHLLPAIALMAELASSARRGDGAAVGLLPGDTLPPGLAESADCVVKRELGRGGMGVVYLAHNTLMGRDEVLKVMGRQVIERPGVLDRFLREIRAVARLRHPNIVAAYHARRLGESLVFAMEYVEGLDLSRLVKARGPMPVAFACSCARQAALGLQHAHEAGLVHRDIKPGNLMLAREGDRATVKILDFGLAKVAREEKVDGGLTREGQAVGTPDYMAPEQITDASGADIRADIYSLGCTLYYFLTGGPPFRENSLYDIYQAHISRDADPLNSVRPEVPGELAASVAKMMAKDPARRFQTPDEVARALEPFVKKGTMAFKSPKAEVSGADMTTADRAVTEAFSAPIHGSTEPEVSVVLPEGAAAPVARWEDVIEWRETEGATQAAPARAPTRSPPWVWPSVTALLLLFGFFAASLGGVFKVKTPDGVIVLENVPKDAEILVDGSKITFTWPGAGRPLEIRAVPGRRKVEVKSGGFRTFGEVVTVKTDESEEVTVRLEPRVAVRPRKEPVPFAVTPGWTSLFNGKDLSGWTIDSGLRDVWSVEDGSLFVTGSGDPVKNGFILSDREFSDFYLRFEFQPASKADSGVTFRARPGEFAGQYPVPLQVEIPKRQGRTMIGALIWSTRGDTLPPDRSVFLNPLGQWNTMEIEVQGDSLRVSVNREEVRITDLGTLADRPGANPALKRRSGRIGFQSHAGTVRFRNIEIKELAATAKVAAKPGPPAFVVLDSKGFAGRRFDTLVEAVQSSSDGDTIEIRGNGPFVTKQVDVAHSLTIRAAAGFRPVIRHSPTASDTRADLISSKSPLVLEGLELWGTRLSAAKDGGWSAVVLCESPLHIANCRLVSNGSNRMIQASRLCRLTNCELVATAASDLAMSCENHARFAIDNCLLAGTEIWIPGCAPGAKDVHVQVSRSTFQARYDGFTLGVRLPPTLPEDDRGQAAVAIEVSQTIIQARRHLVAFAQNDGQPQGISVDQRNAFLRRFFRWRGEYNAYALPSGFIAQSAKGQPVPPTTIKQLDEWRQFSGSTEPGCVQGTVKFQGGDLLARSAAAPEHLTPEDFRLRPESAGYRAGPDGKDLGADIDLVGPGAAYERRKKTPAYQQWLKETGQLAAEVLDDAARARKRQEASVAAARKAVELKPDDAQAHAKLGDALFALKTSNSVKEAEDAYREAIRLKPDDPAAHVGLESVFHYQTRHEEAIAELREAARWEVSGTPWARWRLVWALADSPKTRLYNPVEALDHARKGVEMTHGRHPAFQRVLALAEYRMGHWEEALAALDRCVPSHRGEFGYEWFLRSLVLARMGDKDPARLWYDKAAAWSKPLPVVSKELVLLWTEAADLLGEPGPHE